MNYETVTHDPAGQQCSKDLEVIDVNHATGIVKVRSNAKSLETKLHQLQSEDAKSLAVIAATRAGISSPIFKHATVTYGDDSKGVATPQFRAGKTAGKSTWAPFLVVEVYSPSVADSQFTGDSL